MGIYVDDRTEAQKRTHRMAIVGTDSFMSGWGEASNGVSYAGWAFKDGDQAECLSWVDSRSEMKRVRVVALDEYKPNAAHTHIYVFKPEIHKAIGKACWTRGGPPTESYWYEKLAPLMAEVRYWRKHGAGMIPSSAKGTSAAMNRARQELWDGVTDSVYALAQMARDWRCEGDRC